MRRGHKEIKRDSQRRTLRRQLQREDHESRIREFFLQKGVDLPQRNSTGQFQTPQRNSSGQLQTDTAGSTAPGSSSIVGRAGGDYRDRGDTITNDEINNHSAQGSAGDSCNQDLLNDNGSDLQFDQQGDNDIEISDIESEDPQANDDMNHPLDDLFQAENEQGRDLSHVETQTVGLDSEINDIETAAKFIENLKNARLDDSNMLPDDIARLRAAPSYFPFDVYNPDFLFSLRTFLAVNNASEEVYNSFRTATLSRHPDDPFLSYDQIKRRIQQISGIVPITHDMCSSSCTAFTGPFSNLDSCPICGETRYQYTSGPRPKRISKRQYHTIPLGFVLQAFYRSPENARRMHHRKRRTEEIFAFLQANNNQIDVYDDVYTGSDYLEAVEKGKILPNDIMLQISLDGAQLFRDKESDCWMYIYVIHNLPPDLRYKKDYVIPGGFIPGPNKPKHIDSFIFPDLYHLSALQREGLRIFDSSTGIYIDKAIPFVALGTADGPGMASMAGMVGHQGK